MEARSQIVYRVLQWSFVACVAAALWTSGFYGGLSSGREQGYADGLVPAPEGIAMGQVDAVEEMIDRSSDRPPSQAIYDVRATVAARLGKRLDDEFDRSAIDDEMAKLVNEIERDVAPRAESDLDSAFELQAYPTGQTLVVRAAARRHAELSIYLKSKEDYLAWKGSQPTMPLAPEERKRR